MPHKKKTKKAIVMKGRKPFPIGTVHGNWRKVAEGRWEPVKSVGDKKKPTEKETKISGSPREEAQKDFEKKKEEEYKFARESSFSNKGEDILESARHKRNAWKGLEQAEKDGIANKLVTRDKLLKNEPPDLLSKVNESNFLVGLAMHYSLNKMPKSPKLREYFSRRAKDATTQVQFEFEGKEYIAPEWDHSDGYIVYGKGKILKTNVKVIKKFSKQEYEKQLRKEYVEVYQDIKNEAENILSKKNDLIDAITDLRTFVSQKINKLREKDTYNETANILVTYTNKTLSPSTYIRKNSVMEAINNFGSKVKSKLGENWKQQGEKIVEITKDVLEGQDIDKILDIEKDKKNIFNPADLYVNVAERKGSDLNLKSKESQEDFLLKTAKIRGLQWGNSVTDDERKHHLEKISEAFKDLTDILELPEQMGSFNGKLGLAIGARGTGTALAHYEPKLKTINITRKRGVGSLAHEWGHFFDNILANIKREQWRDSYASEAWRSVLLEPGEKKDSVFNAFSELFSAKTMGSFRDRLSKEMYELKMGMQKKIYWSSTIEVFARCFEKYVQNKLESKGKKNTYLAGLGEGKGYKLWPTDEETKALTPYFDKIFEEFKKSEYLNKALKIMKTRWAKVNKAAIENVANQSLTETNADALAKISISKENLDRLTNVVKYLMMYETKEIPLEESILHITKIDDGIYNGWITKQYVSDTEEIPFRFERKTIAEIVQALEIKGYLKTREPTNQTDNTIKIPPNSGGVNININIQKSNDLIQKVDKKCIDSESSSIKSRIKEKGDYIMANTTSDSEKKLIKAKVLNKPSKDRQYQKSKRQTITKDLVDMLVKSGVSIDAALKEVRGSAKINDVINKLPKDKKDDFLKRLRAGKEVRKADQDIINSIKFPENLDTSESKIEAKKCFRTLIDKFSLLKGKDRGAKTAFAIMLKKYGKSGLKSIKGKIDLRKSENKKEEEDSYLTKSELFNKKVKVTLGDVWGEKLNSFRKSIDNVYTEIENPQEELKKGEDKKNEIPKGDVYKSGDMYKVELKEIDYDEVAKSEIEKENGEMKKSLEDFANYGKINLEKLQKKAVELKKGKVEGPGGHKPDGTGPHGRGKGPGKGKGDGSGLKKLKEEEKEKKSAIDKFVENNLKK